VVGHDRSAVTPTHVPPAVRQLAERLDELGWVTDLLVAGSLATGDYVPGVSDLDLVALAGGPVGLARQEILTGLHRELDQGAAQGLDLGCVYVDSGRLTDLGALHPTWTHGSLVQRILSEVTRAELVRYGYAVLGRPPDAVLPEMTEDDVRRALQTGQLLTKTQAIEQARAPSWLKDQLRTRRQGQPVTSPRTRTALIAWRDARRTIAAACRGASAPDLTGARDIRWRASRPVGQVLCSGLPDLGRCRWYER
jgi:hypothetical protein